MPGADLPPLDPRAYAILAEAGLGDDLFNPRQHRSCVLVERYTLALAAALLEQLGAAALLARPRTVDDVVDALGFVPPFRGRLAWLLDYLAAAGLVAREGAARYRLAVPAPPAALGELRAAALALDPAYAPAYALLDEAAAIYPRVARGETSGERALFLRAALWSAYFSNRNAYYALNNHVAARVAAAHLPAAGGTVLEVGAGLGSAAEALLEVLAARGARRAIARYQLTEPVPFFRRRAERTIAAMVPDMTLVSTALDINAPWSAQDVEPGRAHLVWGVNVFHLARNLDTTLREAHASLAPGGWLVIGEGLRPLGGQPVGAEFPFQLLESFRTVELDPEIRPAPGFLTAEQWLRALERAGFAETRVVPDVIRLRPFYPGLFGGGLSGRRA